MRIPKNLFLAGISNTLVFLSAPDKIHDLIEKRSSNLAAEPRSDCSPTWQI